MSNPAFVLIATNPFGLSNVDRYASPTFVDIDDDGDLDTLIGNRFGDTLFFENTGSASSPAFAPASTNPFGLSDVGWHASPTFADIDGDGDLDALIGNRYGDTLFFENTGTASNPAFAAAITSPFGLSNVYHASPTFVDIDGDGDFDAFIGEYWGDTRFLENTGTASNPAFAPAITNPFSLSNVGYYASPMFVDIDSDGDLDALIGNGDGDTLFFENTGSTNNPAFAPAITNPFGLSDVGLHSKPAIVDIDADGDLDAFIGNYHGDTLFFFHGPSVLITENDDDTTVTEGGATDTYTVTLNTPPTSKVTITLDNTNQQVISDVSTLIFTPTNWNIAQTVTITAVDDTAVEGSHQSLVEHTVSSKDTGYNNLVVDPVTIAIIDNDSLTGDPTFTFVSTNPFGLSNVIRYAKPTFTDINGDGDLDAFVSGSYYDFYGDIYNDFLFFETQPLCTESA